MSAFDVLLIAVIIFGLATAFFTTSFILNNTYDTLLNTAQLNQSQAAVDMMNGSKASTGMYDYVIFGIFIGLALAIIITGWLVGGSSIFMAIYFLIVILATVLSAVMANTWETITTMTMFGSTLSSFPITNNILLNFPIYIAVIGFIGIIVMFGKPAFANRGGGGNEY